MGSHAIGRCTKGGSKDWMQRVINFGMIARLDEQIGCGDIHWLSPLKMDNYREYQLNHEPISKHFGFGKNIFSAWWPFSRQPQWDAVGKANEGKLILVEAKAHLSETNSRCRASLASRHLITEMFKKTHSKLSKNAKFNEKYWLEKYYQTANRILFWDNMRNVCDARLIFLNFADVPFVSANRPPASLQEWDAHMGKVFGSLLGLATASLPCGIKCVNFSVSV